MGFHVVANTVAAEVARSEDDRVRVDGDVTEPGIGYLKHGVQHVHHRGRSLGELVHHDRYGGALLQHEPCVGVVACGLGGVVNHGHRNVAQVHVRAVDVGSRQSGALTDALEHGGLTDAGFAAQVEAVAPHVDDQVFCFLEGDSLAELDFVLCHDGSSNFPNSC